MASNPTPTPATPAAEQGDGAIDVVVRSTLKPGPRGTMVAAKIECDLLGPDGAYLVINPQENVLSLVAPCGCATSVELSRLIVNLADMLRTVEHTGPVH